MIFMQLSLFTLDITVAFFVFLAAKVLLLSWLMFLLSYKPEYNINIHQSVFTIAGGEW